MSAAAANELSAFARRISAYAFKESPMEHLRRCGAPLCALLLGIVLGQVLLPMLERSAEKRESLPDASTLSPDRQQALARALVNQPPPPRPTPVASPPRVEPNDPARGPPAEPATQPANLPRVPTPATWRGAWGQSTIRESETIVRYQRVDPDADGPVQIKRKTEPGERAIAAKFLRGIAKLGKPPWDGSRFALSSTLGNWDRAGMHTSYIGVAGREFAPAASPQASLSWYLSRQERSEEADEEELLGLLRDFEGRRKLQVTKVFEHLARYPTDMPHLRVEADGYIVTRGQLYLVRSEVLSTLRDELNLVNQTYATRIRERLRDL